LLLFLCLFVIIFISCPAIAQKEEEAETERGNGTDFFLVIGLAFVKVPSMRTAIYPGSFDPLTNGHLDVVQRASKLFDRVIVAVARSESKNPLFSLEERVELVADAIRALPNVQADSFDSLLVSYVEERGAQAVIRGLRAVSDFEFEFQLALMNRKLNERVETIFMMPKDTYVFLSSRIVKEIARLGGDVSAFVPAHVRAALARKLAPAVINHA
jgi:pantetheine-phosphate adenylyltransferase